MNDSLGPQRKGEREGEKEQQEAEEEEEVVQRGNGVDFSGPAAAAGGRSQKAQGSQALLQPRAGRSVWVRIQPPPLWKIPLGWWGRPPRLSNEASGLFPAGCRKYQCCRKCPVISRNDLAEVITDSGRFSLLFTEFLVFKWFLIDSSSRILKGLLKTTENSIMRNIINHLLTCLGLNL